MEYQEDKGVPASPSGSRPGGSSQQVVSPADAASIPNAGEAAASLLRSRCGQEFDGECHLTDDEAERLARLSLAAGEVLAGLNARIDAADMHAVPVFHGIADLSDALHAFTESDDA